MRSLGPIITLLVLGNCLFVHQASCSDEDTLKKIAKEIDDYVSKMKESKKDESNTKAKKVYSENELDDAIKDLEKALDNDSKKKLTVKKKETEEKKDAADKKSRKELEKMLDAYLAKTEKKSEKKPEKKPEKKSEKKSEKTDAQIINEAYKEYLATKDETEKELIKDEIFHQQNGEAKDETLSKKSETKECKNAISDKRCEYMAKQKFCAIYSLAMKKRCARTCQFCCADEPKSGYCARLATMRKEDQTYFCTEHKKYKVTLRLKCPRTCGFCGVVPNEPMCVKSEFGCCWDKSIAKDHIGLPTDGCPACEDKQSKVFCNRFHKNCDDKFYLSGLQIRVLCPRTCELCGPRKKCQDRPELRDSCIALKSNDRYGVSPCVSNYNMMKFYCAKTCDICQKSTIECGKTPYGCCDDGKTIAHSIYKENCKECTDSARPEHKCAFWAQHGLCYSEESLMRNVCPGSCGFCFTNQK